LDYFFERLKQGDHYLKICPKQTCLYSLLIDSKVVCYTQLLIKLFPIFILFVTSLYIIWPIYFSWANTATFILFLIGLPVHSLLWLGNRSQQFLSPSLFTWYVEIDDVLSGEKSKSQALSSQPRFIDLANLLNKGFKKGGDNFLYNNELI